MKNIYKYFSLAFLGMLVLASCQKAENLPYYESGTGTDVTLSTSSVTISAANLASNIVTFSWANPGFATDTANYKYVVEIAPSGTNFANPYRITKKGGGAGSSVITGAELNNALVAWGKAFGAATPLEVRLKSSYANNNDMKVSPVVTLTATAYAIPITLAATSTGTFAPTVTTKDNIFTKLSWNAPDYGTATIGYTLEYALAGNNFATVKTITIATDSLQKSLTGMELYQMANNVGIALGTTGSVDVRVKAMVSGTGQVSYSTTQTLKISPVEMIVYWYVPGGYQGWDPTTAPAIASADGSSFEGYIYAP
ncbi:MAG: SusE domain-containing protein, partial [Niabella sp.]